MVQIQIGQGQGITQAIKAKIQADGGKITNNNLSVWQSVMQEVKTANDNRAEGKDPFYTGGEDVSRIGDKTTWNKDFKTALGQVIELAQDTWNKILELLTGKKQVPEKIETPKSPTEAPKTSPNQEVNETPVQAPAMSPKEVEDTTPKVMKQAVNVSKMEKAIPPTIPASVYPVPDIKIPPAIIKPSVTVSVEPLLADNSERAGLIEQKSDDGQIVYGSYKISAGDSGKGFNLEIDNMNISYMSKNNIDVFSNANISEKDYANLICQNAIYNDIIAKQSDGVELTQAEKKYIEAYMTAIDKCNLTLDENGSYMLKGEPVKRTIEFPDAVEPKYDGDDKYASCKNLKQVLKSYGFKVGKEYDTGGGDMGMTVYPITAKDGTVREIPKYMSRNEMAKFIKEITTVPPQRFSFE